MPRRFLPLLVLALVAARAAHAADAAHASHAADTAEIAPGVDLVPGRFVPGTQPDGNSVVFRGPDGLVVVDAGRHVEHTQAILDLAARLGAPIKVVVNTHWHLDHSGGDGMLRRAYPGLKLFASGAIDEALTGFLAKYRAQLQEQIEQAKTPDAAKPWQVEAALIDAGTALKPDEVIAQSGERTLAGRKLDLELETRAVTAGDVWVYDRKTRVLAAGDLVTLPAPLLDTACPQRWQAALDHLAKTDFAILVPGHGALMHRKEFETYRTAFGRLLACSASKKTKDECISGWLADAAPLLGNDDAKFTRALLDYYIDNHLRGDATQTAKLCAP